MMKTNISLSAIVLGMLLMLASASWGFFFPPSRIWSQEKSEQLAELGSKTNLLKFAVVEAKNNPSMHRGQNPAELLLRYEAALAEYDVLHQEFLSASEQLQNRVVFLQWSGIGLIAIGAVITLAARSS